MLPIQLCREKFNCPKRTRLLGKEGESVDILCVQCGKLRPVPLPNRRFMRRLKIGAWFSFLFPILLGIGLLYRSGHISFEDWWPQKTTNPTPKEMTPIESAASNTFDLTTDLAGGYTCFTCENPKCRTLSIFISQVEFNDATQQLNFRWDLNPLGDRYKNQLGTAKGKQVDLTGYDSFEFTKTGKNFFLTPSKLDQCTFKKN